MRQWSHLLDVQTPGVGLYEVTDQVADWVHQTGATEGLLTLLCRHTSASLTLQENAAPAVQRDIRRWLDALAPENARYEHDEEGPDDMPAHLKAMLTGVNLSIPVIGGRMALGTWQGIYLIEHRRAAHRRSIALHLLGD